MELIDTHAHLDEEAFRTDRVDVVQHATDSGILAVITIGTTAESSRRAVELARQYPSVYAAVGIQPNYVAEAKPGDWDVIEELATQEKVVAIGETGLDRYWDFSPFNLQQKFFSKHIELARKYGLPFVVHCRDAEADVVAQLRSESQNGPLTGVMHSFCGDAQTARACLEMGLHISFAGMLTYKKNKDLRSLAAEIPAEKLLVETDSPYLAPTPKRGKRNEPAYVEYTARCLAEARGVSIDAIAMQTTENARQLFKI